MATKKVDRLALALSSLGKRKKTGGLASRLTAMRAVGAFGRKGK